MLDVDSVIGEERAVEAGNEKVYGVHGDGCADRGRLFETGVGDVVCFGGRVVSIEVDVGCLRLWPQRFSFIPGVDAGSKHVTGGGRPTS